MSDDRTSHSATPVATPATGTAPGNPPSHGGPVPGARGEQHITSTTPPWVTELFAAIDAQDSERFAAFMTDDGLFRFGSAPAVRGRANVRDAVAGFFTSIQALHHELTRVWSSPTALFCAGNVIYTRHDGSQITLPFADVFELRDGKIAEYLIYADIAPLYAG